MKGDFILLICIYIIPSIIFLRNAYKASKSGSMVKESTGYDGGYKWVESKENVPFTGTGWFKFWLAFTAFYLVIFALIASDFWDVWFE